MLEHIQMAETHQLTYKVDALASIAVAGFGVSIADANSVLTFVSLIVGIIAAAFSIHFHIRRSKRASEEYERHIKAEEEELDRHLRVEKALRNREDK